MSGLSSSFAAGSDAAFPGIQEFHEDGAALDGEGNSFGVAGSGAHAFADWVQ